MTYTPSGMMETYSDGERVQRNTYIGEETRVRKEEGTSLQNLTDITNYFYQEGNVLYTTDNDNEAKSFNLLNVSDIFATEREGANSDEYYFYLNDVRGSKTLLIDNTAGGIVSYWYNDFGEVSEERSDDYEDLINEVQYTGAIYDSSTGLLYLNARFYDPGTGRFTSQDTYRGERDEPDTWHLYAYCANDPVNYVDPSGHYTLYHNKYSQYVYYSISLNELTFWGYTKLARNRLINTKSVKTALNSLIKPSAMRLLGTLWKNNTWIWGAVQVAAFIAQCAGYKGINCYVYYSY